MRRQFNQSQGYLRKALSLIPVGTQTFSKAYTYMPEGVSPLYLERGTGSHVVDADGHDFVDYICGLGTITLGYNYKPVNEAIVKQLGQGIIFSLPNRLEVELAELLNEVIPCAEQVRFLKTGSEATQAAIRLARAYTGRQHVAYRGYHGWHSWYSAASERPKGTLAAERDLMHQFGYNDLDSLRAIFQVYPLDIAAVIMEPVIIEPPRHGFLQGVKELAEHFGALLIFDETVTGFRWALGGAQQHFGVAPDLATVGKGMANGAPLSAVVGREEVMREFEDVFVSSTFGGECLSLAASRATIREMEEHNTIEHCWEMGRRLMCGLKRFGVETTGFPCRPLVVMPPSDQWEAQDFKSLLLQELYQRGVLIHNSMVLNLCYSHTEQDIDATVEAFRGALEDIHTGAAVPRFSAPAQAAFKRL